MTTFTPPVKLLRVTLPMAFGLLAACGGGSSGSSPSPTTYAVSITAASGGSISPSSATVDAGSTSQFTVTPQSGYVIESVTGCGGTLSGNTYTTGPINADCNVAASFLAQYTVTATAGAGGSISPASGTLDAGSTKTFTVASNSGYAVSGVTGCNGTLSGNTYTTGTVNADCTVTANFVIPWVWVGGSDTLNATGVYGTEGVAAASNMPGAHTASASWTDASGNLWLFGGIGYGDQGPNGVLNDLWEYSPSSGEWTWNGGSKTAAASGVYGIEGVAAASNVPGARYGSVWWTDHSGNFWLFGGFGFDSTGTEGDLNDLWEYSPSSREWTWMSGSATANATSVYGSEGVAAAANIPGARDGAASWTDASGNLWLFGGEGPIGVSGWNNDLWEYSPSSGEWTWMSGTQARNVTGIYGTEGVAAASNMPGGRLNSASWTDGSGNLWLFGGYGYDSTGAYGRLNDLWEYSPSSDEWTWMSGSKTADATAVYGTQGVAAASNVPGARNASSTWTDDRGNLWLLGGLVYDSKGFGYLSDLWEYSPSSGEWTWVNGTNITGAAIVYGTEGVPAGSNAPGARDGEITWTDANGNLWLFGGAAAESSPEYLNDLWEYSPH